MPVYHIRDVGSREITLEAIVRHEDMPEILLELGCIFRLNSIDWVDGRATIRMVPDKGIAVVTLPSRQGVSE